MIGPPRGERGSVTVVVVALLGVVTVAGMGVADAAAAVAAAARAQDAADAAALAAAQEMAVPMGRPPGEVAAEYAARNGSSIVSCKCDPATLEAVVTARVSVGRLLLFRDDRVVDASARAVVNVPQPIVARAAAEDSPLRRAAPDGPFDGVTGVGASVYHARTWRDGRDRDR
jgi:secretion/DNA translocation related TadE-like protein